MTLDNNAGVETLHRNTSPQGAEPLLFRSLEGNESASVEEPAPEPVSDARSAVEMEEMLRSAREHAQRETLAAAEMRMQTQLELERASVTRVLQQFEQEKQRYFSDVEKEVVKLSLAIAERVLHREAEMDPMLLAGAARVALEQVADSSETVLRVSPEEVERWSQSMQQATAKGMVIQPDHELPRGECVLKTRSGTLQLGLRAQLQEIERGFFELLGRRPAMAA